jgi:hypothetical protein
MIHPFSDEDTAQLWEVLVEDLFTKLRAKGEVPDFVKGHQVALDSDWTGDPALYVKILVKPANGIANNATVDRWNDFVHLIQNHLLSLRIQRTPYVQLGEWKRAK